MKSISVMVFGFVLSFGAFAQGYGPGHAFAQEGRRYYKPTAYNDEHGSEFKIAGNNRNIENFCLAKGYRDVKEVVIDKYNLNSTVNIDRNEHVISVFWNGGPAIESITCI
jgi:hypothetical protein